MVIAVEHLSTEKSPDILPLNLSWLTIGETLAGLPTTHVATAKSHCSQQAGKYRMS